MNNRCKNCRIKDTRQDPDIWFNDLFNLSLDFKRVKEKHEKDKDEMKAHAFDVLSEDYKTLRVSCNVNI